MPSLAEINPADEPIKLLMLGHSGVGKTGAIASLASAGYRVFLADFENGYQILMDEKVLPKAHRGNVFVRSFYDKRMGPLALPVGGVPKAMQNFYDALSSWKDAVDGKTVNLGNPYTWTQQDVLVIDSITTLSDAIELHVLQINNRIGQPLRIQDYGTCQEILHGLFQTLCSPAATCNVVFIAHLRQLEDGSGGNKWFPQATGKKISPLIGRYFNNSVLLTRDAQGNREMHTQSTIQADMKVSRPSVIPAKMPADLGRLFKLLKS